MHLLNIFIFYTQIKNLLLIYIVYNVFMSYLTFKRFSFSQCINKGKIELSLLINFISFFFFIILFLISTENNEETILLAHNT